jgi:mRNA interferase YafQ
MRVPYYSGQFKRDVKRAERRAKNLYKLKTLLRLLIDGEPVPATYKDHQLKGEWSGSRDAHVEADWLLIYTLTEDGVRFERTGTHADLFE